MHLCLLQRPANAHTQPPPHLVTLRLLLADAAQAVLPPMPLDHLRKGEASHHKSGTVWRLSMQRIFCGSPLPGMHLWI